MKTTEVMHIAQDKLAALLTPDTITRFKKTRSGPFRKILEAPVLRNTWDNKKFYWEVKCLVVHPGIKKDVKPTQWTTSGFSHNRVENISHIYLDDKWVKVKFI